tara:strand:+ start:232 stop:474 length:243 start_codon:yes stop_codon:yes gene_type:complete
MNPKKDFNLLGNINKGYTKMPEEDTLYIPITEEDGYVLQRIIISEIDRTRVMGFTETKDTLTRINIALQHSLAAAQDKGE